MSMKLEEILEDVNGLLAIANSYANAFEEASIMAGLLRSHKIFVIPFSQSMEELEREITRIKKDIVKTIESPSRENYEGLYERVIPLFRERSNLDQKILTQLFLKGDIPGMNTLLTSDSLTSYTKEGVETLLAFSDGDTIFGENLAQDRVLLSFVFNYIDDATLFKRESIEKASQEVIGNVQTFLRRAQHLYKFDVEGAIQNYASLLAKIQKLCEENGVAHLYGDATPRHVQSLQLSSQSSFLKSKSREMGFVQKRKEIISANSEEVKLVKTLALSPDWGNNVLDVAEYVRWKNAEDIERYHVLDYSKGLVRVPYSRVEISDVIGQEDNVKRLGQLLYSFASGKQIPPIILRGGPGVGKTLSMRALAEIHPDLRIVLVRSGLISRLEQLRDAFEDLPYRIAAYVDDMHFGMDFDFEAFKTTTSGMRDDWPDNVTLVASVNPESYDRAVPSSVKSRWIVIDYGDQLHESSAEEVFKSICKREELPYTEQLYADFSSRYMPKGIFQKVGLKETPYNGRQMEQFIRETKAIKDVEFPEPLART